MSKNKFKFPNYNFTIAPFIFGVVIVLFIGILTHFVMPIYVPQNFSYGVLKFLKDPLFYHQLGLELSYRDWTAFADVPVGQLMAWIQGGFYKITTVRYPFIVLPMLSVLGGITLWSVVEILKSLGVNGRWWPILIGSILSISPSSFSWLVYLHKESFIVPGILLISLSFISYTLENKLIKQLISLLLGSLFVFSCKPYYAGFFLLSSVLILPISLLRKTKTKNRKFSYLTLSLSLFVAVSYFNKSSFSDIGIENSSPDSIVLQYSNEFSLSWNNDISLPSFLNELLYKLAYLREKNLVEHRNSSNFKPDIHIKTASQTVDFLPYALRLAFLEPLPFVKYKKDSLKNFLYFFVQIEMLSVYFSIFLLVLAGKNTWKSSVLLCLLIAIPILIIFGYSVPNIGSINRYRYPFFLLLKLAAFASIWRSSRLQWPGKLLMWIDPPELDRPKKKLLFLVPDDATFVIQRLVMAQGAQKAGYDVHVACPDEGHAQRIKELGFTFHKLDLNRGGLNPFADFMPFVRLVLFLAKERPDILQCVSIKPVIYGATAGTIVGLKKIVCLVNGLGYAFEGTNIKGKIVKFVAKALYRNAFALPGIRVIFQNPDDRDYFVKEQLVAREKTIIIRGSGVNMQKFVPTPQPQNTKPIILFVGRLLWSKGVRELVEAAQTLKAEGLQFELQIIGAPDDRNPEAVPTSYLKEQQELGIVNWLGRQTDMPSFFREADIVALPTVYNEGLPLTLLEAASTGRTLISTDAQGCREIVRHNVNGYLIPPHGVIELTKHLRTLIQNPDLRKQFGETSTKIVREEFSAEIVQQQLLSVYHSLLNDSSHPDFHPVTSK